MTILPGSDNLIKMINLFTDVSFHLSLPLPTLSLSLDVGVWWEVELGGGGGRCVWRTNDQTILARIR